MFPNPMRKKEIYCTKALGLELNVASCFNAWHKIQPTSNTQWYIPRWREPEKAPDDVLMPLRYLSDDGFCAIVSRLQLSLA